MFFIILLFIFLLILIIVNIILISNVHNVSNVSNVSNELIYSHKTNKRLVYGDGKKLVFGGNGTKSNTKTNHNHPSGWQLYTLENCGHCDEQMKKLGKFNTYIKYKEDGSGILVNNIDGPLYPKHIEGFPFWYNSTTGESRYGKQEVDKLLAI